MQMTFFVAFLLEGLAAGGASFYFLGGLVMVRDSQGIPFDTCGLMTSQLWTIGTGGF